MYAWIESDTRQTTLTTRGDRFIRLQVNYGSKEDSKKALVIYVEFPKDAEKPLTNITDFTRGQSIP